MIIVRVIQSRLKIIVIVIVVVIIIILVIEKRTGVFQEEALGLFSKYGRHYWQNYIHQNRPCACFSSFFFRKQAPNSGWASFRKTSVVQKSFIRNFIIWHYSKIYRNQSPNEILHMYIGVLNFILGLLQTIHMLNRWHNMYDWLSNHVRHQDSSLLSPQSLFQLQWRYEWMQLLLLHWNQPFELSHTATENKKQFIVRLAFRPTLYLCLYTKIKNAQKIFKQFQKFIKIVLKKVKQFFFKVFKKVLKKVSKNCVFWF